MTERDTAGRFTATVNDVPPVPTEIPTGNRALELFGELQGHAQNYKDALVAQESARKALDDAKAATWAAQDSYRDAKNALDQELLGGSEERNTYERTLTRY